MPCAAAVHIYSATVSTGLVLLPEADVADMRLDFPSQISPIHDVDHASGNDATVVGLQGEMLCDKRLVIRGELLFARRGFPARVRILCLGENATPMSGSRPSRRELPMGRPRYIT